MDLTKKKRKKKTNEERRTTVLKTEPDRPIRPVQLGANPVRLKPPKPVNNREKTGVEPKILKKRFDVRFGIENHEKNNLGLTGNREERERERETVELEPPWHGVKFFIWLLSCRPCTTCPRGPTTVTTSRLGIFFLSFFLMQVLLF